jgi:hypothetical protein
MPGCTERQSGRIVDALRVKRYGSSSLSPGTIDREEPAGTATGFGPVMTWFDSTLPNQTRARSKRGIAPDF